MQEWEYNVTELYSDDNHEETLNTLGAQGWELVSVIPGAHIGSWSGNYQGGKIEESTFVFKRPIAPTA